MKPGFRGILDEHLDPVPGEGSYISIWQHPESGHRYAIGADVAEGVADEDVSVVSVLDRQTHQQVATFQGRLEADEYARHLARLGQFYDNAVVAVEVNGYGWVVLNVLRKFYSNLFHHLPYDRETVTPGDGWHTNVATKPELVRTVILWRIR